MSMQVHFNFKCELIRCKRCMKRKAPRQYSRFPRKPRHYYINIDGLFRICVGNVYDLVHITFHLLKYSIDLVHNTKGLLSNYIKVRSGSCMRTSLEIASPLLDRSLVWLQ
jgi:hypothetical protein